MSEPMSAERLAELKRKWAGRETMDELFAEIDRLQEQVREMDTQAYWTPAPRYDGRMEWRCPHGIGHGNHIHGCDGCCQRDDYPGRKQKETHDDKSGFAE